MTQPEHTHRSSTSRTRAQGDANRSTFKIVSPAANTSTTARDGSVNACARVSPWALLHTRSLSRSPPPQSHTILLYQQTKNQETRKFADFETLTLAIEGRRVGAGAKPCTHSSRNAFT